MADADKVWVPSKTKVWQLATVDAWKQSTVEVTTAEGQRETLDQAKAARWDPSHDGDIDDLAKMNQLHEAPLLTALGRRYKRDAIYTYTGDVLVSVNPYKSIPLLYDLPAVDDEEAFEAMDASRPHVYGIARRAQAAVRATRVNQSVVVSGESGAGKTEASKKVMAFLLALSAARKDAYAEAAVDVDAVLMVSNVILEAFGNAKTIRNDNSSRFGKYIRLVYDDDWRIAGARTDHFLLEKSRLASVDAGERSSHYFYQLVKAKALPDNSLDDFPLLVAGGVTEIDDHHTVDDAKEFDPSAATSTPSRARWASTAPFLWRSSGATRSRPRWSVVMIPYGDREAKENADALVKFLYGALFDWLLRKLNAEHGRNVASKTFEPFVGILDIFGFEILPTNSFEQLCINFANEMLQRQFNATVFERERAVYESEAVSEGLDPGYVAFDDNRDLVDVVTGAKPAGLFPILEEHGLLHRKPDDKALLRAYHDAHAATPEPRGGKPRAYAKPRFDDGLHFQLRHYAGAVDYDVSGWIVKNNDALAHDLRDAVEASDDGFLRHCLRLPGAPEAGAGRIDGEPIARDAGPRDKKKMAAGQTVSKKFRTQLEELVAILATTSPHYIKCIKPNSSKQPGAYSEQLVVKQLRCSGALEVVRIRREGLPTPTGRRKKRLKDEATLRRRLAALRQDRDDAVAVAKNAGAAPDSAACDAAVAAASTAIDDAATREAHERSWQKRGGDAAMGETYAAAKAALDAAADAVDAPKRDARRPARRRATSRPSRRAAARRKRRGIEARRDRRAAVSAAAATTDAAPFRVDGVVRNKAMAAQVSAARDGVAAARAVAALADDGGDDARFAAAAAAVARANDDADAAVSTARRAAKTAKEAAERIDKLHAALASAERSRDRSSVLGGRVARGVGRGRGRGRRRVGVEPEALAATLAEARRLVTVAEDGDGVRVRHRRRQGSGALRRWPAREDDQDTDAKASRAALVIALEREGASADETAAQAERHAAAAELAEHAAGGDVPPAAGPPLDRHLAETLRMAADARAAFRRRLGLAAGGDDIGVAPARAKAYAATASAALSAAVVARLQACRRRAGRDGLGGPELGGRVRNLDAAALAAVDAAERALGDGTTLDSSSLERTTTGVEAAEKACGEATAARRAEERKVVDAARKSLEESAKAAETVAAARARARRLRGLRRRGGRRGRRRGHGRRRRRVASGQGALHAAADATAALEAEVARSVDARVPAAVKIESVARMAPSTASAARFAKKEVAARRAARDADAAAAADAADAAVAYLAERERLATRSQARRRAAAAKRRRRAAPRPPRARRLRAARALPHLDAAFDLAAEAGVPVDASSPLFAGDDPWALLTTCRHPRRGLQTLAHAAAFGGNASLFELLLPRLDGAALLARDRRGDTPLHCAARATRLDLARAILGGLDRSSTTAAVAPSKLRRASLFGDFRRSGEDAAKAAAKVGTTSRFGRFFGGRSRAESAPASARQPGVVHCGRMRKRKEGDAWSGAPDVKPYAFEVHSAQMLQLGNKAGRMYFACEAPEDLFEWLGAFRETVGAGDATLANLELRAAACAAKNRRGEAALHCACETVDATAPSARAVQLALHLLQFGAALDAPDGAASRRWPSPSTTATTTSRAPWVGTSSAQHATAPLTRSGYLLFGKTWCLQSAVEDLDFGCFVLVELFDRAPSAKKAGSFDDVLVAWARLDLNAKLFESSRDSLEFFLPPFGGAGDAAPAHMFLSLDVYLAKLGDEGDARAAGAATPRHHRVDLI
ncbi:hypothetical protein JL722_456 [Aureococcus anophagefferens]|nr:hypothetical protein JL722_456 [Aureococcus anophagefferens]